MSIFHTPTVREIAGHSFQVSQVPFEVFNEAFEFGDWLISMQGGKFDMASLKALHGDSTLRLALEKLLAACLAPVQDGQAKPMSVADVRSMPIAMVLEAVYVLLEENLSFFTERLQAIKEIQAKLMSIGSPLLSSSSQQATTASNSGATASTS
ncbi:MULTISPECIES: hypothetical protein [Comamonas]|uniref:hypothetical protein n=1 Tax=Comamonas TaxID=283 RepID=UPI0001DA68D8|nr:MULTISPECIES: hypothetical protein [Comamonas]EFI60754.1 hypothetical protein CTS44_15068 [Comamonas thiooxydans]TFF63120.1 hypothetical protein EIC84_03485 [Comamonas sp. A23]